MLGPDFKLFFVGKNQGAQVALVLAYDDGGLNVNRLFKLDFKRNGLHVFAAAQNNRVLYAAQNLKLAAHADNRKVAGVKPAVGIDGLCGKLRPLVVAFHYRSALNLKHALLSFADVVSFHVNDARVDAVKRLANAAKDRPCDVPNAHDGRGLGQAVAFDNLNAERPKPFVDVFGIRAAAGDSRAEILSEHRADFFENDCVAQDLEREQKSPRNQEQNPPKRSDFLLGHKILAEHFSVHARMKDGDADKKVVELQCDSAGPAHFSVNAFHDRLKDARNAW